MTYPKIVEGFTRTGRPYKAIAIRESGCSRCVGDSDSDLCGGLPPCGSASGYSLQFLEYNDTNLAAVAAYMLEGKQ